MAGNSTLNVLLAVSLDSESKKELSEILKRLKLTHSGFVGKLTLNINQGGITDFERIDKIR